MPVVVAAATVTAAGPAVAAPARHQPPGRAGTAASTWAVQQTPNPPSRTAVLAGDSCTSPRACVAVGSYNNGQGVFSPLAETWNGASWSMQKPPAPANAQTTSLAGVSCVSADACVAVGSYRSSQGINSVDTLAEVWNGTSWAVQPTPNPGGTDDQLSGVSCTAADACTAVGSYGDFGTGTLTVAEVWNGTSWSIQKTPNPVNPNHAALTSVFCVSPSACTAVGTADGFVTLAEAWNGTSWSLRKTPNPAGATAGALFGVSCTAASACTAVGNYRNSQGVYRTLAERWNGTSWSIQQAVSPHAARRSYLNAVSCTSATACTAAGNYQSGAAAHITLAEAWNGTSWSIEKTPNPAAPRSGLSGVACPSASFCVAVGGQTSRWQVPTPLAQAWNGMSWSIEATPAPHTATQSYLSGVACPAPADCISVGQSGFDAGSGTLAQHWNGTSWSAQRTPNRGGVQNGLNGVACTSATACTAVGAYFSPRGYHTLAEVWNGATWSVRKTPNDPAPHYSSFLVAVSCASSDSCVAVGNAGDQSAVPFAEVWNGAAWSIHMPVPSGSYTSDLAAVSCTSATACIAVGGYSTDSTNSTGLPLAETWNGTSWSIQQVPVPAGTSQGGFSGVSCTAATACTAVGSYSTSSGGSGTLAEGWNGASWSIQLTPTLAEGGGVFGVACTSPSACTAIGDQGGTTLAEVWDGTSWSIQPTPNPQVSTFTSLSAVACTSPGVCTAVGFGSEAANNQGLTAAQTLAEAER